MVTENGYRKWLPKMVTENGYRKWLPKMAIFIISLFILGYISTKANLSSFTHDESYTYISGYTHQTNKAILSHRKAFTNNHLLNSFLMKYSEKWFGNTELTLRLPNLLLFLVYLFYGYRFIRNQPTLVGVSVFLLLTTNIMLLDFFGLARGYGLSIGFMMMGIYYFIKAFKEDSYMNTILFHIALLLASMSNFSMLMVYASLMATYVVFMICSSFLNVEYFKNSKRALPIHLLGLSICFGVLQIPMIRFLKKNDIFHGGRNGFFQDTMTYLTENVMHNIALTDMQTFFLKIIFCLPVLLSALMICISIIKQKKAFFKKHLSLIIFTFLCIALPIEMTFQHMILGSPYPIERFSIFLIPILFLQWSFYCNYLFTTKWKNIGMSLIILLAFLSTSHFIYKADLYTCAEWHYDKETKNMLHTLKASLTNEQKLKKHQIGLHWHFEPTTNFYRTQMNLQSWLQPCNRDGYLITDSFYYIYKEEIKDIPTTEFKIIKEFDSVGTVLIENLQVEDWRKQNNK